MTQASFPGFEPEPELTDRIFFAVMPDRVAIAGINLLTTELKGRHGMRGRPIVDAKLRALAACEIPVASGIALEAAANLMPSPKDSGSNQR